MSASISLLKLEMLPNRKMSNKTQIVETYSSYSLINKKVMKQTESNTKKTKQSAV